MQGPTRTEAELLELIAMPADQRIVALGGQATRLVALQAAIGRQKKKVDAARRNALEPKPGFADRCNRLCIELRQARNRKRRKAAR